MLLNKYERAGYLCNANLNEPCTDSTLRAFRGELIVMEGEMLDASGRRKPPLTVLQQVALLADENRLQFIAGMLENVADIPALLARYGEDIGGDTLGVIFVYNIDKVVTLNHHGSNLYLIPMDDGLPWSELMQLAGLEKSDIKNLAPADKVRAVFRELTGFRPRGAATVELATLPALSNGKQREIRGAV